MLFFEIIHKYVNANNVKLTLHCPLLGWSLDSVDLTNPNVSQCLEALTEEHPMFIYEHLSPTKQLVSMFYIDFSLELVTPANMKEAIFCYRSDFLRCEVKEIEIPPELEFEDMLGFITKIDWIKQLNLQEEDETCRAKTEVLVMNVEPINQTGKSKFTLKTTPDLLKENLVAVCVPDTFIKFYYPLDKASQYVKDRLLAGAVLTPEFVNIRNIMHDVTNDAPHFIHSLLTHWVVDDEVTDLSEGGFTTLGAVKNVPLMRYVRAPGHDNIFFVIENMKGEGKLKCIEVHKRKSITYRTVILLTSQVTETKRITCGVSPVTLEEVMYLQEPELSARILEREMAENDFNKKYENEDTENK